MDCKERRIALSSNGKHDNKSLLHFVNFIIDVTDRTATT